MFKQQLEVLLVVENPDSGQCKAVRTLEVNLGSLGIEGSSVAVGISAAGGW